jgi:hypothetical protein
MELELIVLDDGFLNSLMFCGYLQNARLAATRTELIRAFHADRVWQSNKDVVSSSFREEPDKLHPKGVLELVVKGQYNRTSFIVSITQQQLNEIAKLLVHRQCPETAALLREYYSKTHAEITTSIRSAWRIFRSNPKAHYMFLCF